MPYRPRLLVYSTQSATRQPPGSCVSLWRPSTLVGLRLGLARPVWGPSASNTWKPGSWALASFHGSGSRGQRPRERLPLGFLEGQAQRHGCRWLGLGRPATRAEPRRGQSHRDRRPGLSRACTQGPAGRAGEAEPVSRGLGLAGAWRPRPAHLLGDPGLQLPADVAPRHAVQVLQLAQQQQGPALGVRVPGARLELQPHARHLPPKTPSPAARHPAPRSGPARRRPGPPGLGAPPSQWLPGRAALQGPPGARGGAGGGGARAALRLPGHRWGRVAHESLEPLQLLPRRLPVGSWTRWSLPCQRLPWPLGRTIRHAGPPFFSVGRLLSLTLARKVTVQQCKQAAPAACTWSPVLGKKS